MAEDLCYVIVNEVILTIEVVEQAELEGVLYCEFGGHFSACSQGDVVSCEKLLAGVIEV
jgi:hypothetical protein